MPTTVIRRSRLLAWGCGASALALTVAGCSGDGGSDSENAVRVQVEASKLAGFEAVAEAYEEANEGVDIVFETITSDQKATTNGLTLASQDAPDLGLAPLNASSYSQLLYGEAIEPLDDVWDDADLWNRYDAETINSLAGADEEPYSVVFENQFYNLLYFNREALAEAGLDYERGYQMTSNDELYAMAAALRGAGLDPMCIGGTSNYQFGWLFDGQLAANASADELSGYLSSGQPGAAEVDYESPVVIDAIATIKEWYDNEVFQSGVLGQNYDTALANFVAGTCGTLLGTATTVSALEDNGAAFDYDWMLLPGGNGPTLPAIYAGSTLVVPTNAANPEQAKDFLGYLLSEEAQVAYVTANGTLPAVTDIPDETLQELLPEQIASVLAFIAENGSASGWTSVVPGELGQGFIDPAIQEMLSAGGSPEETAAAVQGNYESFRADPEQAATE